MASPVPILNVSPPPVIRRAKKPKFCAACGGRIDAGTRYIECSPWRWTHARCPEVSS